MIDEIIAKDSIEVEIKKEHQDVYEHLNNSYYAFYFEKARKAILEKIGFDDKKFKERGIGFFVTSSFYQYKRQLKNDYVKIDSEVRRNKAKIIVYSTMYSREEEKATAKIEHFFVNLKTGKPIKIPEEILRNLETLKLNNNKTITEKN